ncbi:hypothetical protein BQ8482_180016 [Mesorhizobium delmotii]|uniref:Uncharacterized protein n=1 Tax=Mesorhizobium delmotii TaxID=1631247 RepID=A0A2P9AI55_9HYPH|nr:hypothetical protein BQ8482_180016 [Mesorhizobium delmotii]
MSGKANRSWRLSVARKIGGVLPPIFRFEVPGGESLALGSGAVNPLRAEGDLNCSPTARVRQERPFDSDPSSNGRCAWPKCF